MWHYTQWPAGTCLVFIIKVVTTSQKCWRTVPDLKVFCRILACYAFISNFDGIKEWKGNNKIPVVHVFTRTKWNPVLYVPARGNRNRIIVDWNKSFKIVFEASLEFCIITGSNLMNPPATGSVEICVVHRFVGILNTCAFPQEEIQMQKVGSEKIL